MYQNFSGENNEQERTIDHASSSKRKDSNWLVCFILKNLIQVESSNEKIDKFLDSTKWETSETT